MEAEEIVGLSPFRRAGRVSKLGDRLLAIDRSLTHANLPHAFGGAIALAYCTKEPRGTRDIDVNVFVPPTRASDVLDAMPEGVTVRRGDPARLTRDEQIRLMWDDTPVDIFLSAHAFHERAAQEARMVPFEGETIPVLSCLSLTVFKLFFNRTRDWADIEAMLDAGVDVRQAEPIAAELLGEGDDRVLRLGALLA